ncbi:dephospho-CoA kinase [Salinibacterium sp. SYSU T00001]|uniref:dephospho-CoA kinase n=1 Tax=Homoserinimonas sedimenticola TaxID=2986805 RepID=UPI0022356170|nr:dephospho-CoA kinase [Salinibacterium sedimenticola]MCW4384384.1 dephospho-CoA kinase [Salinibacterium sedimenticola]
MYLLALTGGIASGKSLVADRLRSLGAVHIDADLLAREVVAPGSEGLAEIVAAFGDSVVTPGGELDRAALGSIVFSDPESLARLNRITHPRVRELTARRIADAAAADPEAVVVYDVPLLAESGAGASEAYDLVVVVAAERALRLRRMVERRGMSEAEAAARIDAQASDAERAAIADVVIDNNGTVEELLARVDALWVEIAARAAASS